jgi:16S rRNA G966 N2-methylase RsmD
VGIEAVSRGVEHVTSVESHRDALELLQQNLDLCHICDEIAVVNQTVQQFLSHPDQWNGPYDVVFADPPYAEAAEFLSLLAEPRIDDLFAPDSWLVIEHAAKTVLPMSLGCTQFLRRYRYGDTALSLYSRPHAVPA